MNALHTYHAAMTNLTYVKIDRAAALLHWNVLTYGMVAQARFFEGENHRFMLTQKCVAGIHGHRANRRRMMILKFRERQIKSRLS